MKQSYGRDCGVYSEFIEESPRNDVINKLKKIKL
jgi:hypothetical protein